MKRVFDIIASGLGLLILSPLFLVVAIWVKLDSTGPVFYKQVRVGRNNKDFYLYKFRSMRVGSDKKGLITVIKKDSSQSVGAIRESRVPATTSVNINWTNSLS